LVFQEFGKCSDGDAGNGVHGAERVVVNQTGPSKVMMFST
jgi:hypothetical protein